MSTPAPGSPPRANRNHLRWVLAVLAPIALVTVTSHGQAADFITGPYADEEAYWEARRASARTLSISDSLGLVRAVELTVSDQVEGRCWTEASAAKARMRAELERSGIATFEEPLAFHNEFSPSMRLIVLGYRMGDTGPCVANASILVTLRYSSSLGSLAKTGEVFNIYGTGVIWEEQTLFSALTNLNDQVMSFVQEGIDSFSADVLAGRRSAAARAVLDLWSNDPPITQAEWDEIVRLVDK